MDLRFPRRSLAAGGGVGLLAYPVAALSLGGVVALTALEFLVAFLQAFVFAVLATIYINDVVNLGHGEAPAYPRGARFSHEDVTRSL